jgi:hypothetical protein
VVQTVDPLWTEAAVIHGLSRLSHLEDLQLTLNRHGLSGRSPGNLRLDRLPGLKKISLFGNYGNYVNPGIMSGLSGLIAKSPQLVYLEIKLGSVTGISQQTLTLHDVLNKVPEGYPLRLTHLALNRMCVCVDSSTLPHLRSLVSLDLRNLRTPSNATNDVDLTSERREQAYTTSDICTILKQENIYLQHIVVSDVGVFDYLCSYSGLETLDLCMKFNNEKESDTFARQFYKSVLPHLVDSLQVLKIQPNREGPWCYNPNDVSQSVALSRCNKLRSLTVALNTTSFIQSMDYLRVHQYKDNLDDAVCPGDLAFHLPMSQVLL